MTLFKEVMESIIKDPPGGLTWLTEYITGETKELIKHCIGQSGNKWYENTIKFCKESMETNTLYWHNMTGK